MNKVLWNDSYLLGIPEIDNQHKKLIRISEELFDVIQEDLASFKLKLSKVLKELTDYTEYHFSSEEKFMSKYNYAGSDAHKIAHDGFIAEVTKQIKNISSDNKNSAIAFYDFMTNWIIVHIAKADQIWAKYVKSCL